MVELQPSKLTTWVRFPSSAPFINIALFLRLFLFIGKILERSCIRFIDLDIKFLDHHNLNEGKIIWNIIA